MDAISLSLIYISNNINSYDNTNEIAMIYFKDKINITILNNELLNQLISSNSNDFVYLNFQIKYGNTIIGSINVDYLNSKLSDSHFFNICEINSEDIFILASSLLFNNIINTLYEDKFFYIHYFELYPQYRGKGIGSKIFKYLLYFLNKYFYANTIFLASIPLNLTPEEKIYCIIDKLDTLNKNFISTKGCPYELIRDVESSVSLFNSFDNNFKETLIDTYYFKKNKLNNFYLKNNMICFDTNLDLFYKKLK